MLFNSFLFIFGFLPVALGVFFLLSLARAPVWQMIWLAGWSFVFYAHWKKSFLFVLLVSLTINYLIARLIMHKKSKPIFITGIIFNICVIAYFKYRGFFLENINEIANLHFALPKMVLPLGISFITFQKIAYLADVYAGRVKDKNFLRYLVFISFFPQLIAGPIVHYNPLMSQFSRIKPKVLRYENMVLGLMLFIMGLAKKVILADTLATYADPAFSAALSGQHLTFLEGWIGVLAYTFQIYFDFSGYSDMAIGLARMFGIRLPINFNSPYKAASIIEFWRRWHITLSIFLRNYIYIPLGGNRKGEARKYINLMLTMLLGGLWHGANWTFIIWGAIHGFLLSLNHIWLQVVEYFGLNYLRNHFLYKILSHVLTFFFVATAWIYFRMPNKQGVQYLLNAISGRYGFGYSDKSYLIGINNQLTALLNNSMSTADFISAPLLCLSISMFIIWFLPNSQQIVRYKQKWDGAKIWEYLIWKPRAAYLVASIFLFYSSLFFMMNFKFKPFAYFAF